jgi:hypothetical protein
LLSIAAGQNVAEKNRKSLSRNHVRRAHGQLVMGQAQKFDTSRELQYIYSTTIFFDFVTLPPLPILYI